MNSRSKYFFSTLLLVLILIVLTIGYSLLSTSLNINGSSSIHNSVWDVHFENVVVSDGSVSASTPVISTGKTTVTYDVTLTKPGDFYEFTVDAKNDGTVDAMIELISSKLNNSVINDLPSYLNYEVSNSDGTTIETKQALYSGNKHTYKVRVEYKKDVTASDLPTAEQILNFSFAIDYVQTDGSEINPTPYYIVNAPQLNFGYVLGSGWEKDYMRSTPEEAIEDWLKESNNHGTEDFYIVVYVNGRSEIVKQFVGFKITDFLVRSNEGMALGTYKIQKSTDSSIIERNREIIKQAYGYSTNPSRCYYSGSNNSRSFVCAVSGLTVKVYDNGNVLASVKRGGAHYYECKVLSNGSSCYYSFVG